MLVRLVSALFAACVVTIFAGASAAQTIKLGYLTDTSGPTSDISKPSLEGFKLYMDRVNKAGGILGQKVEVDVRDTGIDTARAIATAEELAANNAIAIIGLPLSTVQAGVYAAMERAGVPVVAGYPSNIGVVLPPAKPNAFAIGVVFDLAGWIGGDLSRRVSPNGKSLVCVTFESPGGIVSCKGGLAAAKKRGFEKVETITFPIATRDFRTIAQRVVATNPDVVLAVLGRSRLLAMVPALANAGYKGAVLSMEAGTGDDAVRTVAKQAPAIEMWSYTRYVSSGYGQGPQVTALTEAAKAAGISEWLAVHSGGWTLAMVMESALKACGKGCTPAKLQAALSNLKVDTGGLTGAPIQFTANDHYGPSTYLLTHYDRQKDKMEAVGDWTSYSSSLPTF